jgi:prepilin-type N-terminal cleavage/methylation domain-containing protein
MRPTQLTVAHGATRSRRWCGLRTGAKRLRRLGFTLLELMLALALVVVATALIGSLMSLYARSFTSRAEDVRRNQLARSLLAMIADDIRAVVTQTQFDSEAFELLFSSEPMDLENFSLTDDEASSLGLEGESEAAEGEANGQTAAGMDPNTNLTTSMGSSLPTGVYGNQFQLMVDVSRAARVDELAAMYGNVQPAPLGTLRDIPGDMKRVTYYLQTASPAGVQDVMSQVESRPSTMAGDSGGLQAGLVRRQLDRNVTSFAEASGLASQLAASGDMVSPEVVSLEFSFFDGAQWTYQWDSSTMGLPWLINISLAMQSATGQEKAGVPGGLNLSTLSREQMQAYGIEVYELTVAIPGAQLSTKPNASDSSSDSSGSGQSTGASSSGAAGL